MNGQSVRSCMNNVISGCSFGGFAVMRLVRCRMYWMYDYTSRLSCFSFRSSERSLNSSRGGLNVCLSREMTTSNDPKTNGSCSLRPKAQVFTRPAKFNWANATCIRSSTMWRALMVSSNATKYLNRESSSVSLYLEMPIFSNSGRRVCVDPVAAAWYCLNSSKCWALCSLSRSVC